MIQMLDKNMHEELDKMMDKEVKRDVDDKIDDDDDNDDDDDDDDDNASGGSGTFSINDALEMHYVDWKFETDDDKLKDNKDEKVIKIIMIWPTTCLNVISTVKKIKIIMVKMTMTLMMNR